MHVVVGAPVAERAWVLPRWHEAVIGQARSGLDIEVVCHYTHSKDQTLALLADRGVTVLNDPLRPTRPVESIDRHEWRFGNRGRDAAYMADLRNVLVAWVEAETEADYFLSLDTDIILPGGALAALLEDFPGGALSPLVDLAHPCVGRTAWNFMSWLEGEPRRVHRTDALPPARFRADTVGAAILLDRSAMAVRWAEHPQGEDVGWSLDAERRGIARWVDPEVRCEHLMVRDRHASPHGGSLR